MKTLRLVLVALLAAFALSVETRGQTSEAAGPQDAVYKVKQTDQTMGRYVATDYNKCVGCYICADVCPSGYIQMGLGE